MNYIAIIVLTLIIFFLMTKKKPDVQDLSVSNEIQYVLDNITIISSYEELKRKTINTQYVLIANKELADISKLVIIKNFVANEFKTCGFNYHYTVLKKDKFFKKIMNELKAVCVNYINIMDNSHTVICGKSENIKEDIQKNNIISFEASEKLKADIVEYNFSKKVTEKFRINLKSFVSVFLTIFSGSIVLANVLYNAVQLMQFKGSIYDIVVCVLIYICYSNITIYVYASLGKFKFIASYFFPIFIVLYLLFSTYYYIKYLLEVRMNNKKRFLISLVLLLLVYIIFILLSKA